MPNQKSLILDSVRILPREAGFLDRKLGSRGEIFFDRESNTLRLFDGIVTGGLNLARGDLVGVASKDLRDALIRARQATVYYTVTIAGPQSGDSGNKYYLNSNYRPTPNFVTGYTYVFDQSDDTNVYYPNANGTTQNRHPLNFSDDNLSGVRGGGTAYTTDVVYKLDGEEVTYTVYNSSAFDSANTRTVQITITNDTPELLYYWCFNHLAMGQQINVADPGTGTASAGGGTSTGGGTSDYDFQIAADDSTMHTITAGNTVKFVGGTGIDTTATADGTVTIQSSVTGFYKFAVAGNSDVQAASVQDTVTLVGDGSLTISTNPSTKTITFTGGAGGGGGGNAFSIISVAGQSSVVADQTGDTLTLVGSGSVTVTTDTATDTITITGTAPTTFQATTDATRASLTIDQFYMQAITRLTVTPNGSIAYLFDQYAGNNPTIYAISGTTIAFNLQAIGHPFAIQDATGTNYNTGLTHVQTDGAISTGSGAQGRTTGTLYWKIPLSAYGTYRYQCTAHAPMVGAITVKNFATI
jgi:hypothetical protein